MNVENFTKRLGRAEDGERREILDALMSEGKPRLFGAPESAGTVGLLVNIDVDDLNRAVAFYAAAFGLWPARRFGEFGVEMLGAACAIYLLAKPSGSLPVATTPQRRDYRRHWTPVHLDFVVPNVAAAVRRAAAAGARAEEGIRSHGWGRIAVMADPFGHGFCLIEFAGRGYDAIATSQE
jgi:predicted enzyme related to lactoylglutathione lyase